MGYANVPPRPSIETINEQERQITAESQYHRPASPAHVQHVINQSRAVSAAQLALPHQVVKLKNTGEQEYIFTDRYKRPVSVKGGQTVEADLLTTQIQHLIYLSRTDRGHYESGIDKGKPFPAHCVKVVGFGLKGSVAEPQTV
jgi:hypothetical protein